MIILEIHNSIIEALLNGQIETYLNGEKTVVINTKILGMSISIDARFLLKYFLT